MPYIWYIVIVRVFGKCLYHIVATIVADRTHSWYRSGIKFCQLVSTIGSCIFIYTERSCIRRSKIIQIVIIAGLLISKHGAGGRHALLRHGRRNHLLPSSGRPSMRQRGVVRHGRRSRSRHRGSERSHIYNLGWFTCDLALKSDKVYSSTAVHLRCLLAASQRAVHGRRVGAHGAGEHRRRVVEAAHGPSPVQVPARGNYGILWILCRRWEKWWISFSKSQTLASYRSCEFVKQGTKVEMYNVHYEWFGQQKTSYNKSKWRHMGLREYGTRSTLSGQCGTSPNVYYMDRQTDVKGELVANGPHRTHI